MATVRVRTELAWWRDHLCGKGMWGHAALTQVAHATLVWKSHVCNMPLIGHATRGICISSKRQKFWLPLGQVPQCMTHVASFANRNPMVGCDMLYTVSSLVA